MVPALREIVTFSGRPVRAVAMVPARGDHVALVSQARHLLLIPLDQVPELARGKGVILQRSPQGPSDIKAFVLAQGLTWADETGRAGGLAAKDCPGWVGKRGDAGRLAPRGFPRSNRFGA